MLRSLRLVLGLLSGLLILGAGALALGLSSRTGSSRTGSSPTTPATDATPTQAPRAATATPTPPAGLPTTAGQRPSHLHHRGGHPAPAHPVPSGWFAVSPGAPSDAQVAAELVQEQLLNRQLTRGFQTALASDFADYGLGLACGGVLGTNQLGVANLTLPCGTLVTFRYKGRVLRVPVIDRGPYIVGRLWDLTGATAAALGFPGLDQIQWKIG